MGKDEKKIKGKGPSKIEDFSVPILCVKDSIGIFWDVEDYPFPHVSNPDLIYEKILEVLCEFGVLEQIVSIWAYVDKENKLWAGFLGKKKTWNSRIYFIAVAGDDKLGRVNRMHNDILLWNMDLSECNRDLVVMSDEINSNSKHYSFFFNMLQDIGKNFEVLLYTGPKKDYNQDKYDWPTDIFDDLLL